MAPCGKSKCDCGCKKKKAVKRKAPVKRRPLPQRGSNIVPSYPGAIQQQFVPSFETPIPSAVSKITGDRMVKRFSEMGVQTDVSYFDEPEKKVEKKVRKPRTKKIVVKSVEEKPVARALSKSAIAAIARSQSARPIERVGNVVSFGPEPVEQPPGKVEDIKPRGRSPVPVKKKSGRPTNASKIAMSGTQPLISSVLPPRQN